MFYQSRERVHHSDNVSLSHGKLHVRKQAIPVSFFLDRLDIHKSVREKANLHRFNFRWLEFGIPQINQ